MGVKPPVSPAGMLIPTLSPDGKRRWIYPERRSGPHARRRRSVALVLMLVYLVLPWMEWQGVPIWRFDVQAKRIYLFGQSLRFHETYYLIFVFLFFALVLFFFTALRGRLWCGYACPQTVFIEWLIRPIEEWLEGPALRRRKNDAETLTFTRLWRKGLKHLLFVVVAIGIANVFLAYFVDPRLLKDWVTSSPTEHPLGFALMAGISLVFYLDFSWFREQFCAFLCPYARFQTLLIDDNTPVVSYDFNRGEPRGKRGAGDCIDCGLCVRVCPTAIDIRGGLQLECIQCLRCVDACDEVMGNLGRPLGLIREASAASLETKALPSAARPFSVRALFYGLGAVAVLGAFVFKLYERPAVSLQFIREKSAVFSVLADGRYANMFRLHSINNSKQALTMDLDVLEPANVELICGSCKSAQAPNSEAYHTVLLVVAKNFERKDMRVHLQHRGTGASSWVTLILP